MGYKLKNISYLLEKSNPNHNKQVIIKIENNFKLVEYKILPYQEIIFDSKLLPIEVKKMELLGMIQAFPISDNYIDSINNPKIVKKESKKSIQNIEKPKKEKISDENVDELKKNKISKVIKE
jgi:hypothetical protein